jgi:tetratricopeptide (TPR) repeat protein
MFAPVERSLDSLRRSPWPALLILALATWVIYWNSLAVPFLFDDGPSILQNPAVAHASSVGQALSPPRTGGLTVSGRPLLNFTLAANHARGGRSVRGYHLVNVCIHLLAAWTLFGVVRRTVPRVRAIAEGDAGLIALTVALIWAVHPLQTEAVTYIVQRAESLASLCYLLTLYGFIRGTASARPAGWYVLSVAACFAGAGTKEIIATAPLLALLYDRTFVAADFREAWRRRWRVYAGLAASWLWLGYLVASSGGRGGTAGLASGVAWWKYAWIQFYAIGHYLRLAFWPSPLVFDYGRNFTIGATLVLPGLLLVALLVTGSVVALGRRSWLGFLGAWFFLILAPSSSVVPVATETMAEHRMYLPLAALVAGVVGGLYGWLGRRGLAVALILVAPLALLTVRRNQTYGSALALWTETAANQPRNARARDNLGEIFTADREWDRALASYEEGLKLDPDEPGEELNVGSAWLKLGNPGQALPHVERALRLQPDLAQGHDGRGITLDRLGRIPEAVLEYREALRLQPDFSEAHDHLANALVQLGQTNEAFAHYQEALRLDPNSAAADYNLANALLAAGRGAEALPLYRRAVELDPASVEFRDNFGSALARLHRPAEAIEQFTEAIRLEPGSAEAHNNLGSALVLVGRTAEARIQYEEALRLRPDYPKARENLDWLEAALRSTPP